MAEGVELLLLFILKRFGKIVPVDLQTLDGQSNRIGQSPTDQFNNESLMPVDVIVNKLTFTHLVELTKISDLLKRKFYEMETISNNWSVKSLERAMATNLYERVCLNKTVSVSDGQSRESSFSITDIIKDPYVLEFLDLKENPARIEADLEQRVIDHLQNFLLELGKGFCFEARQKRISIENTPVCQIYLYQSIYPACPQKQNLNK